MYLREITSLDFDNNSPISDKTYNPVDMADKFSDYYKMAGFIDNTPNYFDRFIVSRNENEYKQDLKNCKKCNNKYEHPSDNKYDDMNEPPVFLNISNYEQHKDHERYDGHERYNDNKGRDSYERHNDHKGHDGYERHKDFKWHGGYDKSREDNLIYPPRPPLSFMPHPIREININADTLRGVLRKTIHVWLHTNQSFWFHPTEITSDMIWGYRWTPHLGWINSQYSLNMINGLYYE